MTLFSWQELAEITQGQWLNEPTDVAELNAISTDSRQIEKGNIFLALSGDRFDGHRFLDSAVEQGAACLIVSQKIQADIPTLIVNNTLTAYQHLANYHRNKLTDFTLIGITGSSGKTSSKEIIGSVLKAAYNNQVILTKANTNNQIGVPQNLMRLNEQHHAAVIEMGTNYPGEIEILSKSVEPDIAVLTNVGPVHLEGLGSIEGVAREKSSLFKGLTAGGTAIVNDSLIDNPIIIDALPEKHISYGIDSRSDYQVEYLSSSLKGSEFRVHRPHKPVLTVNWELSGLHMAQNAAAAIATADLLNIDDDCIVQALNSCHLPGMRMKLIEQNGIYWVNDAYNANPDSMRALIDWLYSINETADYLVLGDMLEMGEDALKHHKNLLNYAEMTLADTKIIAFGNIMSEAAGESIPAFSEIDSLKHYLSLHLKADQIIAIKGSRGMALERLIDC